MFVGPDRPSAATSAIRIAEVVLGILGIASGAVWLAIVILVSDEVGESLGEVAQNRLWTPALFGLLAGFVGLTWERWRFAGRTARIGLMAVSVGVLLMFLGNFVEYWLLFELSHDGPGGIPRGIAWMTVLFGLLVVLLGLIVAGIGLLRGPTARWLGIALVAATPLTIGAAAVNIRLIVIPLASLAVASGIRLVTPRRRVDPAPASS